MTALIWKFLVGRLAAVLAFFAIRAHWVNTGRRQQRQADASKTLQAVRAAVEVENEVEALDREALKSRARKWVRGPER